MNERELRRLIGDVKTGRLSRRGFVQRMVAVGLTAPMATQLLAYSGVAMAQPRSLYKPTKRGGGGLHEVRNSSRRQERQHAEHPAGQLVAVRLRRAADEPGPVHGG